MIHVPTYYTYFDWAGRSLRLKRRSALWLSLLVVKGVIKGS